MSWNDNKSKSIFITFIFFIFLSCSEKNEATSINYKAVSGNKKEIEVNVTNKNDIDILSSEEKKTLYSKVNEEYLNILKKKSILTNGLTSLPEEEYIDLYSQEKKIIGLLKNKNIQDAKRSLITLKENLNKFSNYLQKNVYNKNQKNIEKVLTKIKVNKDLKNIVFPTLKTILSNIENKDWETALINLNKIVNILCPKKIKRSIKSKREIVNKLIAYNILLESEMLFKQKKYKLALEKANKSLEYYQIEGKYSSKELIDKIISKIDEVNTIVNFKNFTDNYNTATKLFSKGQYELAYKQALRSKKFYKKEYKQNPDDLIYKIKQKYFTALYNKAKKLLDKGQVDLASEMVLKCREYYESEFKENPDDLLREITLKTIYKKEDDIKSKINSTFTEHGIRYLHNILNCEDGMKLFACRLNDIPGNTFEQIEFYDNLSDAQKLIFIKMALNKQYGKSTTAQIRYIKQKGWEKSFYARQELARLIVGITLD